MRFRAGLAIGAAVGFYAGAWAGRERYEQINRALRVVRRSHTFDTAADKAKAVVDLGVERAKDIVESKLGHESGGNNAAHSAEVGSLVHAPDATGADRQTESNGDGPDGPAD